MIEVLTTEQLTKAIRKLRADCARGMGTMELIRSLEIDPLTELRGGDWRGTSFAVCDLRGADLSACRLSHCDFTDADVAGTVFYGADLYRSTLHRAKNVSLAYLSDKQREYLDFCIAADARAESDEGRVFQINQRIRDAATFRGAKAQFESIRTRGLQPDQYSAGLLIGRTADPQEAWEAFGIADAAECPMSDVVFTILASRMRDVAGVRSVMDLMRSRGFAADVRVYNTLLSRIKLDADRQPILAEMEFQRVGWDNVTYAILMRRTDFAKGKTLLKKLVNSGLHPSTAELNILMRGANSEDEADEVLEIGNELEVGRDTETYALLAPYKARPHAFRGLIDDMTEDDLHRDAGFYTLAIRRAKSFSDACFLYGRMKRDAVSPSARIYDRLAELAAISSLDRDPNRTSWPEEAIAGLIRHVGTPEDIRVAGVGDGGDSD